MSPEIVYDDDPIKQNEHQGPGWFLKIAYAVITIVCVYYLFTYWDWKSNYDEQQQQIQTQIGK